MSRIIATPVLFGLVALPLHPLSAQNTPRYVPPLFQEASSWCWAASAQMAMEALGAHENVVRQRIQAGRRYPPPDKCYSNSCSSLRGGSTSGTCNFSGFPQFYKFGFDVEVTPMYRPLTWPELRRELGCRPVVFAREDLEKGQRTGKGHMVVATSARIADNGPWIAVNDPGPPCDGSMRSETYQEYRGGTSKAHWIDYYGLREAGTTFTECDPPAPEPPLDIRESSSPNELVVGFIAAIQHNNWIRKSAELTGDSSLNCDPDSGVPLSTIPQNVIPENAVPEKTISIASLRAVPPKSLDLLLVDSGRLRFVCRNGTNQSFSVEVEKQPLGKWRVASIGDIQLATRLKEIQAAKQHGQQIQEVFVLGLNVRFARLVGDPPGLATPLSSVPGYDIAKGPQSEVSLLEKLRTAAASFRASGPT